MRSTRLIGIGALTAAALLGTSLGATAYADGHGSGDDRGYNQFRGNEHDRDHINQGFRGYRIVTATGLANGSEVTATCPIGGRVTGGGVKIDKVLTTNGGGVKVSKGQSGPGGKQGSDDEWKKEVDVPSAAIQGTFPADNGSGWTGIAFASGNPEGTTGITVFAICTRVDGEHHF